MFNEFSGYYEAITVGCCVFAAIIAWFAYDAAFASKIAAVKANDMNKENLARQLRDDWFKDKAALINTIATDMTMVLNAASNRSMYNVPYTSVHEIERLSDNIGRPDIPSRYKQLREAGLNALNNTVSFHVIYTHPVNSLISEIKTTEYLR